MGTVVVCEKPSVARDIAKALGSHVKQTGYMSGNGYAVTWSFGHLLTIAEPHQMNPQWKKWRFYDLPIIPKTWELHILENSAEQFQVIQNLMHHPKTETIICATDAGREGELIFRYIYEKALCQKPVKRLWISSLTNQAICEGLKNLKSSEEFDSLAESAKARSHADWLFGMNLSRAYSLKYDKTLTIGRVQTPTLGMIIERQEEIEGFKIENYKEVKATFSTDSSNEKKENSFQGTYFKEDPVEKTKNSHLSNQPGEAEGLRDRVLKKGSARIHLCTEKEESLPPPRLYDLTALQKDANRFFKFSAEQTLNYAQELYEKKKLITYPRTDCSYLSKDMEPILGKIVEKVLSSVPRYRPLVVADTGKKPLSKRYIDSERTKEHHAIIPTEASLCELTTEQRNIYDLICRRFLSAWQLPYQTAHSSIITEVSYPDHKEPDYFQTQGKKILELGWKKLDLQQTNESLLPSALTQGAKVWIQNAKIHEKKTTPPLALTDASLLSKMQRAGQKTDKTEKSVTRALYLKGIGTPATRAQTIESLVRRGYVTRKDQYLIPTEKGRELTKLIKLKDAHILNPELTARWEADLEKIAKGKDTYGSFLEKITLMIRDLILELKKK